MQNWNRLNQEHYDGVQTQLQRLGIAQGDTYRTTPNNKVHIPLVNGCYGLNVLGLNNKDNIKKCLAMLSVESLPDKVVSRYYATGEEGTNKFVRPGLVDKLAGIMLITLAEPDTYDGYQITATNRGLVTVEGILPEAAGLEGLPTIEEHPESANSFLFTIELALERRARQVEAA